MNIEQEIKDIKTDVQEIRKYQRVQNRETGELVGELRIIRWLMGGTILLIIGQWITSIIF